MYYKQAGWPGGTHGRPAGRGQPVRVVGLPRGLPPQRGAWRPRASTHVPPHRDPDDVLDGVELRIHCEVDRAQQSRGHLRHLRKTGARGWPTPVTLEDVEAHLASTPFLDSPTRNQKWMDLAQFLRTPYHFGSTIMPAPPTTTAALQQRCVAVPAAGPASDCQQSGMAAQTAVLSLSAQLQQQTALLERLLTIQKEKHG